MIRAKAVAAALKNSSETIGDSFLIAMIVKGLPSSFNSFKTVVTQEDTQPTFQQFKVSPRVYGESEHSNTKSESVIKADVKRPLSQITCFTCKIKKGTCLLSVNRGDGVTTASRKHMILNFVE